MIAARCPGIFDARSVCYAKQQPAQRLPVEPGCASCAHSARMCTRPSLFAFVFFLAIGPLAHSLRHRRSAVIFPNDSPRSTCLEMRVTTLISVVSLGSAMLKDVLPPNLTQPKDGYK